jgi:peptidoglycan hydrolase-like protein with peptidoglycan-binding domain
MHHLSKSPRRRLGGLVAVLVTLLAATAIAAPAAAALKPLKKGHKGERVAFVQRTLGLKADGIFGPATKKAVKSFQRRKGLTVDGIVGPATWSRLQRVSRKRAAARKRAANRKKRSGNRKAAKPKVRSRGALVKVLQRRLRLPVDGVFGPQTRAAVKRFQRSRGLYADGVVGPVTWRALGRPGTKLILKSAKLKRRGGGKSIRRVIAAANRIASKPYKWGGGHGRWKDTGYDCSGSVSYALHGGGLLKRPLDSSGFMRYGKPGKGKRITIYANPGHVFMVINGRRFDTSGQRTTGSRWQPTMRSTAGYVARHPAGF